MPYIIGIMNSAPDSSIETILERMRAGGGRITKKRIRIVEVLMQFEHPASADEIRQKAGLPETDLVTVYRNLEALQSIGVIQRIPLENGTQLFELTAPGEHYHHLICRECHQAERLDLCIGKEVLGRAKAHGYSQITHVMEVYGVCKDCDSHS
jgi:Fe2+ or Zn2+ uptake regulation protein